MASDKQIKLIKDLYSNLGQEVEIDIENLSCKEADVRIKELLELSNNHKSKFEPHEDNCYWY